jgi:integrase
MTMASGSLRQRYPGSWSLILDLGYETDPATGKRRRKQKWITHHCETRKEAQTKLREILHGLDSNTFVEPSKTTLIDWMRAWVEKSVKPPMRRPATYRLYKSIIETHMAKSRIALVPLQRLSGSDLERYLADLTGAAGSVAVHHAILHRALRKAVKNKLLTVNPAHDLERRRVTTDHAAAARAHCWSRVEARSVLEAAKKASPQVAAFMCLALDSGARKSELNGLKWTDFDLDAGTLTIERQLDKPCATVVGDPDMYGPTKTKRARTFSLIEETVTALRTHRRTQLELKLKNGGHYQDHGLVFAKEHEDCQTPEAALGQPLATLGDARFVRLVKQAGVKRIKFHGCRHTAATLLLQAGVLPHVVAARLGHSVVMLMTTYAHAIPSMQQDAATRLGDVLHGGRP